MKTIKTTFSPTAYLLGGVIIQYSTQFSEEETCMYQHKYDYRFILIVYRFQNCLKKPDFWTGVLGGKPWKCQLWFELTKRNLEDG